MGRRRHNNRKFVVEILQNVKKSAAELWKILRTITAEISYWQDAAKRQTAGIIFTHRPKMIIFAMQGRLVAPIHVKFGTTKGTWVRLATRNFT